jgi:outer membrane protein assembly factor BamB
MKKLLTILAGLLAATTALSQEGTIRIHTKPVLPSLETLDRLNLKMAWKLKLPMDGLRDGFYSLQLFPGKDFTLMLAQTYQGAVVAINAETGDVLWRTLVGRAYQIAQPAAVNSQTVIVNRREVIYALDRDSGKQMLYTAEEGSTIPVYGTALEGTPSAGVAADEEKLFVPLSNRVVRYDLPNFRAAFKARPPATLGKLEDSPQIDREWSFDTLGGTILQAPILNAARLILTSTEGTVFVLDKFSGDLVTRFKTEGSITGVTGYNKNMIYIPGEDYFLYAFDTAVGRLKWRFPGQSHILRSPVVNNLDVYVAPSKAGLYRVDRASGEARWNNRDAVKFLSVNKRFVYALDRLGQVMVLDYERGKELARWDTRDWTMPLSNDLTDRIYLAANDGQIVCMHLREQVQPLIVKTFEDFKAPPPKKDDMKDKKDMKDDSPKDDKKDDAKDKDDKKDDAKDKDDKKGDAKDKGANGKVSAVPQEFLVGRSFPAVLSSRAISARRSWALDER